MSEALKRFFRFLINFGNMDIQDCIQLSIENPEKYQKIYKAHRHVFYKAICRHLEKSLILYLVPYGLDRVEVVDWSGEYPFIREYQPFMGEVTAVNIDTGEPLKANELTFYHPGFVGLPELRTDFPAYYGQSINPSPRSRIFDMGRNARFYQNHFIPLPTEFRDNPFARHVFRSMQRSRQHQPNESLYSPFAQEVQRMYEQLREQEREQNSPTGILIEDEQDKASAAEIEALMHQIDTLLEGEDEPVADSDTIPIAAPHI